MAWPWKYGQRQPLPPDDLPEDFSEDQDIGEDDDEDLECLMRYRQQNEIAV